MPKKNLFEQEIASYTEAMRQEAKKLTAPAEGVKPLGMTEATPEQQEYIYDYPETLYPEMPRAMAAAQLLQDMGPQKYAAWVRDMYDLKAQR